jgi:hypothetical protein
MILELKEDLSEVHIKNTRIKMVAVFRNAAI